MNLLAGFVVVCCGMFFIAVTGVVFTRPAIVVSSAALICVPWRWHHWLGERVLPMLVRHLKLYAVGMLAFGVLLLYGVFRGGAA